MKALIGEPQAVRHTAHLGVDGAYFGLLQVLIWLLGTVGYCSLGYSISKIIFVGLIGILKKWIMRVESAKPHSYRSSLPRYSSWRDVTRM